MFKSPRARRQTLAGLFALAVGLVLLTAAFRHYVPAATDAEALRAEIRAFGPLAPVAFVALQAAQVVVAPVPGQVLAFVSGYLFGMLPGAAYSLLGAAIGSYVAFRLSRRFGRTYVERVVTAETLTRFDALTADRGLAVLFFVFLVPGLPDDVVCFAAGLSDLSVREMVVVSVLGRLPGYLVLTAAGAGLAAERLQWTALLLAAALALTVLGYVYRERALGWVAARRPEGRHA